MRTLLLAFALACLPLSAEDAPACPLCGKRGVAFEDTADGAFKRFRFAIVTRDAELLTSCTDRTDDYLVEWLKKSKDGWEEPLMLAGADADAAKVEGDRAAIRVRAKGGDVEIVLARSEGGWRIAFGPALDASRHLGPDDACIHNLRTLGVYMVMWVTRFGNDRSYPGPGLRMLTGMMEPKTEMIYRGLESLLHCGASGSAFDAAAIRRGDAVAIGYACCETAPIDEETPLDAPIVWDKTACHGDRRHVLLYSGAVVTMSEKEFQEVRKLWK